MIGDYEINYFDESLLENLQYKESSNNLKSTDVNLKIQIHYILNNNIYSNDPRNRMRKSYGNL